MRRQTAAGTVSIQYDGEGNRVGKIVTTATNTVVTLFVVDEQNPTGYAQVLEELEAVDGAALAVSRVYTYGHTLISQDRRDGPQWQASFYGVDGHNNVRYLTDANGVVTDTYDYDAFGNLIAATGTTPNRYLYSGEQYDADLGLYYLRARYHNPDTGRFWSMDSYEGEGSDPGTLHKYTYCGNNPVNAWDPSGQVSLGEVMTSAAIGAGLGTFWGFLDTYVASDGNANWEQLGQGAITGAAMGAGFGLLAPFLAPELLAGVAGGFGGYSVGDAINQDNWKLALFRALSLGLAGAQFNRLDARSAALVAELQLNPGSKLIAPKSLRFSQKTAGGSGRSGILRKSMRDNGYVDGPQGPIDVVEGPAGPVTMDNTRVALALELGIELITANIHGMNELLPAGMAVNRGWNIQAQKLNMSPPKTWGDALKIRTQWNGLPIEGTAQPPRLTGD